MRTMKILLTSFFSSSLGESNLSDFALSHEETRLIVGRGFLCYFNSGEVMMIVIFSLDLKTVFFFVTLFYSFLLNNSLVFVEGLSLGGTAHSKLTTATAVEGSSRLYHL